MHKVILSLALAVTLAVAVHAQEGSFEERQDDIQQAITQAEELLETIDAAVATKDEELYDLTIELENEDDPERRNKLQARIDALTEYLYTVEDERAKLAGQLDTLRELRSKLKDADPEKGDRND
jgi:chromosome segregation ATPase